MGISISTFKKLAPNDELFSKMNTIFADLIQDCIANPDSVEGRELYEQAVMLF